MKKWLINNFLPMWAKETVLDDNKRMRKEIFDLRQENRELKAYIQGVTAGQRAVKQIRIYNGGEV